MVRSVQRRPPTPQPGADADCLSPLIMIAAGDDDVRSAVANHLAAHGMRVVLHADGASALVTARTRLPHLLIVDGVLARVGGVDVCRSVRAESDIPIIMLTRSGGAAARIEALENGADDCLAPPLALRELQLRVRAQLRHRPTMGIPRAFRAGVFQIDPALRRVRVSGREVVMTGREYDLFVYLLARQGELVTREEILRDVWHWEFGGSHAITVYVRRLREKIEPDPSLPTYLRTKWGAGYRLVTG